MHQGDIIHILIFYFGGGVFSVVLRAFGVFKN